MNSKNDERKNLVLDSDDKGPKKRVRFEFDDISDSDLINAADLVEEAAKKKRDTEAAATEQVDDWSLILASMAYDKPCTSRDANRPHSQIQFYQNDSGKKINRSNTFTVLTPNDSNLGLKDKVNKNLIIRIRN